MVIAFLNIILFALILILQNTSFLNNNLKALIEKKFNYNFFNILNKKIYLENMEALELPSLYTSEIADNINLLIHYNEKYTKDSQKFL